MVNGKYFAKQFESIGVIRGLFPKSYMGSTEVQKPVFSIFQF